jgi:hypothetical protein
MGPSAPFCWRKPLIAQSRARPLGECELQSSRFSPFEESLLILKGLETQLESALRALHGKELMANGDLKWTVCNHIQILLCSFLDEWKIFESFGKDERIRDTLKIAAPALERIRAWTGLERVRSTLLVHNLRDKEGNPVSTWNVFNSNKIPTAYAEIVLLARLAVLAIRETRERHYSEFHLAAQRLTQYHVTIKPQGIRTSQEAESAFQVTRDRMDELVRRVSTRPRIRVLDGDVSRRRLESSTKP